MLVVIWLVAVTAAAWLFLRRKYSYLSNRGVNSLPTVPVLGNLARATFRLEHFSRFVERLYEAFPDDKFVGYYEFIFPVVVLRDPELIKQICVKDFDHFLDHRVKINENHDPLFGRNLFSLKGQKWRDMRATLSPAFTGSKMRHMVPFMVDCAREMSASLKEEMKKNNVNFLDIEFKDLCTRFSNDVVASCVFGLKVNSYAEKNNHFYQMGKIASNFSFRQLLMMFGFTSFPYIMDKLRLSLFGKETTDFFRSIVNDTMTQRERDNIMRPDMIHLLMEAKKGKLRHDGKSEDQDAGFATVEESAVGQSATSRVWTDDDLVAQAMIFFVAGFDTVAVVMTFLLHELALNPEVQERLLQEIESEQQQRGSRDLAYSDIQDMKYMDMVVSDLSVHLDWITETLRKWSPGVAADRVCVKSYNLGRANSKSTKDYIVHPGQGVWIPIWAIHRHPGYYPDPDKFDPERFSNLNKHKIDPNTYMPFGIGPRNCIGSRFALMEVKILVHQLLSQFQVTPSARTRIPVQLSSATFNLRMEGGHWLKLQLRAE